MWPKCPVTYSLATFYAQKFRFIQPTFTYPCTSCGQKQARLNRDLQLFQASSLCSYLWSLRTLLLPLFLPVVTQNPPLPSVLTCSHSEPSPSLCSFLPLFLPVVTQNPPLPSVLTCSHSEPSSSLCSYLWSLRTLLFPLFLPVVTQNPPLPSVLTCSHSEPSPSLCSFLPLFLPVVTQNPPLPSVLTCSHSEPSSCYVATQNGGVERFSLLYHFHIWK